MEYYLFVKRNEIMNFAYHWMELGNILSEVTQTQKEICCMPHVLFYLRTLAPNV